MVTDTLLIEIGTEELPPKSLNKLRLSLATNMREQLDEAELAHGDVHCHATPRRLALVIEQLVDQQPDQHVERRGPAVKAAYDDQGNPSKALAGFMRSCGIEEAAQLETLQTEEGEWLVYRADRPGASLRDLLPLMLENALATLPIDRRMRWGNERAEFIRPVKWLVSLYGKQELPIELFGMKSGRKSMGHRFMSDGEFELAGADVYVDTCLKHYVKVDFDARRQEISDGLEEIAVAEDAELALDPELLDEVSALVEWPVVLAGHFDEAFLTVPAEVLISAMKEHQRYFHLTKNGELLPTFITVANIASPEPAVVIAGNERVIRPRLADAAFFFDQDTKSSLEQKVGQLGSVVFQTDLGTYGEKATRIAELAGYIAGQLDTDSKLANRAGLLAKADLVSDLVGEFPDLQGVMGSYYALNDREPNEVAKGIAQHYRPSQSGAELPEGKIASAVALADKIDTLTGLFGIDQPPTGSRDPFALRRQSLGVIRICIENQLSLDIAECVTKSAELYDKGFSVEPLKNYIVDRLDGYYKDLHISKDVVDAAIAGQAMSMNLLRVNEIIQALAQFQASPTAARIVASNKRVANLLKKADVNILPHSFDLSLATEPAEIDLHNSVAGLDLAAFKSVKDQLAALAELQEPIDLFFDKVMVMAEDASIRNNRLTLLRDLRSKFLELADFSLLQ